MYLKCIELATKRNEKVILMEKSKKEDNEICNTYVQRHIVYVYIWDRGTNLMNC